MNLLLLPLCLFVLLMAPAVGVANNQQISRLTIVCALLLLVKKVHAFKWELHHKLFAAWIVWAAIGACLSEYPAMAFFGWYPYRGEGLLTWLVILCFAVVYWQTYQTLYPLAWTCLGMFLVLIVGHVWIVKCANPALDPEYAKNYFQNFFLPPVAIASFACQASALFSPIFAILGGIVLVDCASRAGLVAWGVFTAFSAWRAYKGRITPKIALWVMGLTVLTLMTAPIWGKWAKIDSKLAKIPSVTSQPIGARSQWCLQSEFLMHQLPLTGYGLDTLSEYLTPPDGKEWKNKTHFYPDRTHCWMYDLILCTGWLGYTMILLSVGYALAVAIKFPSQQNTICMCMIGSYIVFTFANPAGLLSQILTVIALLGIQKPLTAQAVCAKLNE